MTKEGSWTGVAAGLCILEASLQCTYSSWGVERWVKKVPPAGKSEFLRM